MPWLCRRHDVAAVSWAEKVAEVAQKPVPVKPGGFFVLLLTSIGLALAGPLMAMLLLRFGLPSEPCPDLLCEQRDAANLAGLVQMSLPGLVLLLLAAAAWILRRRLIFAPPPDWPPPPKGWVPPPRWQPPGNWAPAPDNWRYWRLH